MKTKAELIKARDEAQARLKRAQKKFDFHDELMCEYTASIELYNSAIAKLDDQIAQAVDEPEFKFGDKVINGDLDHCVFIRQIMRDDHLHAILRDAMDYQFITHIDNVKPDPSARTLEFVAYVGGGCPVDGDVEVSILTQYNLENNRLSNFKKARECSWAWGSSFGSPRIKFYALKPSWLKYRLSLT